ncbi:adrenodoxin-like protein 2, mitochondrial [Dorcoceras hygrometricum]|uniref:2Fe-2S ferredoxin n=1 Tax=Dorcoceras hygrometricum TaxID=472368 RepID=A0A2Z7BUS1_9LAMI|nr:adrenodoxin-like protein 2, mitochondrial [Dorcoceras hygrometricum]
MKVSRKYHPFPRLRTKITIHYISVTALVPCRRRNDAVSFWSQLRAVSHSMCWAAGRPIADRAKYETCPRKYHPFPRLRTKITIHYISVTALVPCRRRNDAVSFWSQLRAVSLNFSYWLKNMLVSRFYRLGSLAIQRLLQFSEGLQFCLRCIIDIYEPRTFYCPFYVLPVKQCGIGYQRDEFFSTAAAKLNSDEGNETEEKINVTFVDQDGEETNIKVPVGMSMLEAAHENDLDLEGACEASLACSTCHVIVMDICQYNKIPDPTDEENDMLDLAFGLTETSRLGCQIIATPELDGIRLAIPSATRNFAVDGYKPKPH